MGFNLAFEGLMWGRAVERGFSAHCFLCITDCKDTALLCALILCSGRTEKKESSVGQCDDKPNIVNEKKIPLSTRTPEEIIINLLAPELFFFNFSTHCI
jgi:hypothetical protein